jgi:hypothetical protein
LLVVVAHMEAWLPLVVAPPLAYAPTPGSFVSWNPWGRFRSLLSCFFIPSESYADRERIADFNNT